MIYRATILVLTLTVISEACGFLAMSKLYTRADKRAMDALSAANTWRDNAKEWEQVSNRWERNANEAIAMLRTERGVK